MYLFNSVNDFSLVYSMSRWFFSKILGQKTTEQNTVKLDTDFHNEAP